MNLFRVFDWDGASLGRRDGGPLFVARTRQGGGRHDNPSHYGAWYCSRQPISAVAESIKHLRGHVLTDEDFLRTGAVTQALVGLRLEATAALVDLDDPLQLSSRALRPSHVATMRRVVTQRLAKSVFDEGAAGIRWWSTLEADWTNVTLFYERAVAKMSIVQPPRRLTKAMAEVREAAEALGVEL